MGTFRFEYQAAGGHGCDREAQEGEPIKTCAHPESCPDCGFRAFVASRKFTPDYALFTHWPRDASEVVDDLKTGTRLKGWFGKARTEQSDHIEQFALKIDYGRVGHPDEEGLQAITTMFADLAWKVIRDIPRNPERTVALRKILEARDAAVRALTAK